MGFFAVVAASASLKARLREVEDEVVTELALLLTDSEPDGATRLVAGLVMLTWRTAYGEAIAASERGDSEKKANAAFIALIDRGFAAVLVLASAGWTPTISRRG